MVVWWAESWGAAAARMGGFTTRSRHRPGLALLCCGAFLLGWAEGTLRSEPISEPCPHSTWAGHRVCRHWRRKALSALAKLDTRESNPTRFLLFFLQRRGYGQRGQRCISLVMGTSDEKWQNHLPLPQAENQNRLYMLTYPCSDVSRHTQISG